MVVFNWHQSSERVKVLIITCSISLSVMEPVCVSLNQHIVMNPNCVYLTEQTSQVNIAAKGKYSDLFNQPLCVNEPKMCK